MRVVTVDEMRRIEAESEARGVSTAQLMENAGLAVAEQARDALGDLKSEHVVVLVGPGNNGGDGLVAARHLDDWGARVHVYVCGERPTDDPHLETLRDRVADVRELRGDAPSAELRRALDNAAMVVDAMLGTGRSRPLQGPIAAACGALAEAKGTRRGPFVLALDVPTGLDADTGAVDPATPAADATVALGYPKVGLFLFPGAERVGHLSVADLGIPDGLDAEAGLEVASPDWVAARLPERPISANKGSFGKTLIVAGSASFIGAANLACAGAVRSGAGLVTLAAPRSLIPAVAAALPEVTYVPLDETAWGEVDGPSAAAQVLDALSGYDSALVGPGLGQGEGSVGLVSGLAEGIDRIPGVRLALDADALNILSRMNEWWTKLPGAVVTPHPGEMARLTGRSVEAVQSSRIEVARAAAETWGAAVLLKGAYSVTALAGERTVINPFANPALATAGTGDVLAGIVVSLLAQGLPPFDAAVAAAYLHGAAGEEVRGALGDAGAAASDLPLRIPPVMQGLRGE